MTKCGIAFGVNKVDGVRSCCLIYITKDGLYCVTGERGEDVKLFSFWKKSEHIRQSDETNTLMVAKVGKEITVWINGHDVTSLGDDWMTSGCVGIFAASGLVEPEGHVRFRNFEVYAIE